MYLGVEIWYGDNGGIENWPSPVYYSLFYGNRFVD